METRLRRQIIYLSSLDLLLLLNPEKVGGEMIAKNVVKMLIMEFN